MIAYIIFTAIILFWTFMFLREKRKCAILQRVDNEIMTKQHERLVEFNKEVVNFKENIKTLTENLKLTTEERDNFEKDYIELQEIAEAQHARILELMASIDSNDQKFMKAVDTYKETLTRERLLTYQYATVITGLLTDKDKRIVREECTKCKNTGLLQDQTICLDCYGTGYIIYNIDTKLNASC